jgi:hypothetical protein
MLQKGPDVMPQVENSTSDLVTICSQNAGTKTTA